jgi:RNA polymerase sigma-70 factor (ECF subfamily)
MGEPVDGELVRQARLGDPSAFQHLVDLYAPIAWRTALVFLKDRHLAEDAVQEAWLDVWRGLPRFREGEPFRPWLVTLIANRCRKAGRNARERDVPLDDAAALVSDAEQPESRVQRVETFDALREALADLPQEQRRMLELRYFADLELAEIAAVTSVPVGTVKSRLHRALRALRDVHVAERLALVNEEELA